VSEPVSIFAEKPSSRGFFHTLVFGSLCVITALVAQHSDVAVTRHDGEAVVRRSILVRLIADPRPVQPSGFDEESTMNPAQLMNRWDGIIAEASARFHVPKDWIRAVMARESGGRTMLGEGKPIVSSAGAVGLMQVLPETYDEMAAAHRLGSNPFDAHDNIMAGAAYLGWLHRRYGYPAMFAAYNAGPGRLEDHLDNGARLPAETRAYIGDIAKTLHGARGRPDLVAFTQPDGQAVKIDPAQVVAIRAPLPGEYGANVKSVLTLDHHRQQGICEDLAAAQAAIGQHAV
jgi:hypothetical protein